MNVMTVEANRDRNVAAWLRSKAGFAEREGHADIARAFSAAAEDLEIGLHPEGHQHALQHFFNDVHARNVAAGWWTDLTTGEPKKRSVGELFMLFVTEMAEAYDAYSANTRDDKLPQFPGLGVEIGDLTIRVADFCGALAAGRIVIDTDTMNPGDRMFREVVEIARRYEAIRKTDAAIGEPEKGDYLAPQFVGEMIDAKLLFNANREDHKIENRLKEDGKRT